MRSVLITIVMMIAISAYAEVEERTSDPRCPKKCVKINLDERYAPEWCCKVLMCNTFTFNNNTQKCELAVTKAEEYPVPCLKKDDTDF